MKQIISRLSEVAITNPEEINIQELLHMFSLGNANEKWISSPGLKVFWVASDIAKWRNQDVHATEIAIYSKVASKRLNDAEVFGVTFTGSVVRDGCVPIGNRSFVKLELHGEVFSLPSSLSQGKGVIQKAPIKTGIE